MTKYICNNGYSSFYVEAGSLTEVRANLIRKLGGPLINGRALYTVYKGNKKAGILIWDMNGTGKIYWFTVESPTKNFFGKLIGGGKARYEVNVDGSLGRKIE